MRGCPNANSTPDDYYYDDYYYYYNYYDYYYYDDDYDYYYYDYYYSTVHNGTFLWTTFDANVIFDDRFCKPIPMAMVSGPKAFEHFTLYWNSFQYIHYYYDYYYEY